MVARVSQEVVDGKGEHGGCHGTYMLLRWRGEKEIPRNRDRGADFAQALESGHGSRKRGGTRLTSGTQSSTKEKRGEGGARGQARNWAGLLAGPRMEGAPS